MENRELRQKGKEGEVQSEEEEEEEEEMAE